MARVASIQNPYSLLNRNCCHFAEALCAGLGVEGAIPPWINRAATVGASVAQLAAAPVAAATAAAAAAGMNLPSTQAGGGNPLDMLLGGLGQAFTGVAAQMSASGGGAGLANAANAFFAAQTGAERQEVARSVASQVASGGEGAPGMPVVHTQGTPRRVPHGKGPAEHAPGTSGGRCQTAGSGCSARRRGSRAPTYQP